MDPKNLQILNKTHERLGRYYRSLPRKRASYRQILNLRHFAGLAVPDGWDWRDHMEITPAGYQGLTGACFLFASLYSFCDRYAIALGQNKYVDMSFIAAAAMMSIKVPGSRPLDGGLPSQFNSIFQATPAGFTVPTGDDVQTNYADFCGWVNNSQRGANQSCCDDSDNPRSFCYKISDDNQQKLDNVLADRDVFNIDFYQKISPQYPDPVDVQLSFDSYDGAISFDSLKGIVATGGPIPYVFLYNADFPRNTDYSQTGGIYMCTSCDDTKNPFGYNGDGPSGSCYGHCISIIGYGEDKVDFTYNGKSYKNVNVQYVWIRNSWGPLKTFVKVAWEQSLDTGGGKLDIMKGVWTGGTSVINVAPVLSGVSALFVPDEKGNCGPGSTALTVGADKLPACRSLCYDYENPNNFQCAGYPNFYYGFGDGYIHRDNLQGPQVSNQLFYTYGNSCVASVNKEPTDKLCCGLPASGSNCDQTAYQDPRISPPCPGGGNCSGHGTCKNGVCSCTDCYSGDDCATIPNCGAHGSCVDNACKCDDGYTGVPPNCRVLKYKCVTPGQPCQEDPGGDYDDPDVCAQNCRVPPKKYKCFEQEGKCREDPSGDYDDPNVCAQSCQVPPPKKYKCVTPGQPCQEDPGGDYDDPDVCAQNCRVPPKKYKCFEQEGECREDPRGSFDSLPSCNSSCAPPAHKSNAAVIILSVLGGLIFLSAVGLIIYFIFLKKKQARSPNL